MTKYEDSLFKLMACVPRDYNSMKLSEYVQSLEPKVEHIGTSSEHVEYEGLDTEQLYIGGNLKYARLGGFIYLNLWESNPVDVSLNRVNELLEKLDTGNKSMRVKYDDTLEVEDVEDWEEYNDDELEDELKLIRWKLVLKEGTHTTTDTIHHGEVRLCPLIIPEGMSGMDRSVEGVHTIDTRYSISVLLDDDSVDLMIDIGGLSRGVCRDCGDEYVYPTYDYMPANICPRCKDKYRACESCGANVLKDTLKERGGMLVCEDCFNMKMCMSCGKFKATVGDSKEYPNLCMGCVEQLNGYNILSYHSRVGRRLVCDSDIRFKIGYEVEKEDRPVRLSINQAKLLNDTGWVAETDSSLARDSGFELISPVYPLDLNYLTDELEKVREFVGAKATVKCGGHIHVSDTERTPYEILSDSRGYLPLLYSLYPKRAGNEYCKAKDVMGYLDDTHRQAIKVGRNTIEFRIFPKVDDIDQLLFRTKLVEYILNNPNPDVISVGKELLNKDSGLYRILNEKISSGVLKKKAIAFVDYTNYIDRDGLVLKDNDITRVIAKPKMKEDYDKTFEEKVKELSPKPEEEHVERVFNPETGMYTRVVLDDSSFPF